METEEIQTSNKQAISPTEWRHIELKGYMSSVDDLPRFGIKKGWRCMNCHSMVYYNKCANDQCYNFYMYTDYTHIKELDKEFWDMFYNLNTV